MKLQSTIAWIDHDPDAHERMQRILRLFDERDTRDELGLGAIRDSFSDLLFPGTSTIQTRLRYFLFVAWIYKEIEEAAPEPSDAVNAARNAELDLSEALVANGETEGVFGQQAGRRLKTLPSAIYWAGLAAWGIRRFDGTRRAYLTSVRFLNGRRQRLSDLEDGVGREALKLTTWDPNLPKAPTDFPSGAQLSLRSIEAEYLRDRVAQACTGSLLAHLFLQARPPGGDFPWEHPEADSFAGRHQTQLYHARLFSQISHGASLLYNLLLSEEAVGRDDQDELVAEYRAELEEWAEQFPRDEIKAWDLDSMWPVIQNQGHHISARATSFVRAWKERAEAASDSVADDREARTLIRRRESWTKGPRARLENPHLLKQWGGRSAAEAFTYRWSDVRTLLDDLRSGLEAT